MNSELQNKKALSSSYVADIKSDISAIKGGNEIRRVCNDILDALKMMGIENGAEEKVNQAIFKTLKAEIEYVKYKNSLDEKSSKIIESIEEEFDLNLTLVMEKINLSRSATSKKLKKIYVELESISEPIKELDIDKLLCINLKANQSEPM